MSDILWDVSTAVIDITPVKGIIQSGLVSYAPPKMWEYVLGYYMAKSHCENGIVRIPRSFSFIQGVWDTFDDQTTLEGKMRYLSEYGHDGFPLKPDTDVPEVMASFLTPLYTNLNIAGLTLFGVNGDKAVVYFVRSPDEGG